MYIDKSWSNEKLTIRDVSVSISSKNKQGLTIKVTCQWDCHWSFLSW